MNIANTKSLKMKVLIVALLLSGGSVFGLVLSKETADAYATSISDVFAPESQEAIEKEIAPALSQINPEHAKDTVKKTKSAIRQYKGQINGSFVAGAIFAIDAANTQAHDVESALASTVSAPLDAPATNDNIGAPPEDTTSALSGASADISSIAPTDDVTAANASMPFAPSGGPGMPVGVDSNTLSALPAVDPAVVPQAPIDQNAMLPSPTAIHPEAAVHHAPTTAHHIPASAVHHAPTTAHHTPTATAHRAPNTAHHTSAAAVRHAPTGTHHTPAPIDHNTPISHP